MHLLPSGCQGDLQVGTHPEAIPDEGEDHKTRGEEKRGDIRDPLCRLQLCVCWRNWIVPRGEIEKTVKTEDTKNGIAVHVQSNEH